MTSSYVGYQEPLTHLGPMHFGQLLWLDPLCTSVLLLMQHCGGRSAQLWALLYPFCILSISYKLVCEKIVWCRIVLLEPLLYLSIMPLICGRKNQNRITQSFKLPSPLYIDSCPEYCLLHCNGYSDEQVWSTDLWVLP